METLIFGVIGMLVGLTVTSQFVLAGCKMARLWNIMDVFWLFKTFIYNAVFFAFVGNAFFA
ncbi:MAG: cbb3-type cytochrome oxidase subunit 1 [Planctomycetota bacterium]|jgi:cbb3-type cytochrome oxidase subunit 1